ASAANGAQFQLKNASGTVLTTVNVPNTGGWQTWQTISATVTLPAGQQTIRLFCTSTPGAVFNINWLEFASSGTTTTTPAATASTTRIQCEYWNAMSGVATENAWGDPTGGGLDVGWIDPGDWMDYGFNAPSAGTYTVNFRIASAANGAQLQLKDANGTVLTTVNVPNTGGWQTWQTISATVTLPAGQQTIRLQSSSTWGSVFNINWLEFVSGSSLTATVQRSTSIMTTETTASTSAGLDVFPNPVTDRFALQVNNNLTGTMTVQILDLKGAVQKQFTLTKAAAGTAQFYLSIGDLAAANYVVKAIMGNWSQTKQIVKQ
ncbi:MAG: carbohydrate-binding protein, partial [Flavisolibacter sp.]